MFFEKKIEERSQKKECFWMVVMALLMVFARPCVSLFIPYAGESQSLAIRGLRETYARQKGVAQLLTVDIDPFSFL